MIRKILPAFIISILLSGCFACSLPAAAVLPETGSAEDIIIDECSAGYSEAEIIKRAGLRNKFRKSDAEQISDLFKKYNKYAEKNKFDKLKEIYTEDFINNDGFNKQTMFKVMESAAGVYKNIKYNTVIDEIKISGKYASVKAHETAEAETGALSARIPDTGIVHSESEYIDFLVKEGNKWKIRSSEILSETVSVKYGEAQKASAEISAPDCAPAGSSYDVSVTINAPENTFLIGSINNEKIVYPQENKNEIYRKIKDGQFARVLNANSEGRNEYASCSIAFTRAEVKSMSEISLNITGAAFLMKRVNTVNPAENKEAADGRK